eukprot:PhF_6_TR21646/c0_g1_i2/m.30823
MPFPTPTSYLTTLGLSVVLVTTGDAISQLIEMHFSRKRAEIVKQQMADVGKTNVKVLPQEFIPKRSGRQAITAVVGTVIQIPFYYWLEVTFPGSSVATVWTKIVVDTVVFCFFDCARYLAVNAWLAGESAWEILKKDFWPSYFANFLVWVPGDWFVFTFIDPKNDVIAFKVLDLIIIPIASYIGNRHLDTDCHLRIEHEDGDEGTVLISTIGVDVTKDQHANLGLEGGDEEEGGVSGNTNKNTTNRRTPTPHKVEILEDDLCCGGGTATSEPTHQEGEEGGSQQKPKSTCRECCVVM